MYFDLSIDLLQFSLGPILPNNYGDINGFKVHFLLNTSFKTLSKVI